MKEMEADVNRVLRGGSSHEVLSEGFGLSLTRKDLQTLSNLNWLNDEASTHYPQDKICVWIISRHSFCTRWPNSSFGYAYIIIEKKTWPGLYCACNNCLTTEPYRSACPVNWNSPSLISQVINFYMNLLVERSKDPSMPSVNTFNTFFYPKLRSSGYTAVRRWTKKMDIFSKDILLVPVHLGVHWCLSVSLNGHNCEPGSNNLGIYIAVFIVQLFLPGGGFPQKGYPVLWFYGWKQWWSMQNIVVSFSIWYICLYIWRAKHNSCKSCIESNLFLFPQWIPATGK